MSYLYFALCNDFLSIFVQWLRNFEIKGWLQITDIKGVLCLLLIYCRRVSFNDYNFIFVCYFIEIWYKYLYQIHWIVDLQSFESILEKVKYIDSVSLIFNKPLNQLKIKFLSSHNWDNFQTDILYKMPPRSS